MCCFTHIPIHKWKIKNILITWENYASQHILYLSSFNSIILPRITFVSNFSQLTNKTTINLHSMKNAVGATIPLRGFYMTSPTWGSHLHPWTPSPFLSSAIGILVLNTGSSLFLPLSCPQTSGVVLSPASTGLEPLEGSRAHLSLAGGSLGLSAAPADGTVPCPACSAPHWGAVGWLQEHRLCCPGFTSRLVFPHGTAPPLLCLGKILGMRKKQSVALLCCAVELIPFQCKLARSYFKY